MAHSKTTTPPHPHSATTKPKTPGNISRTPVGPNLASKASQPCALDIRLLHLASFLSPGAFSNPIYQSSAGATSSSPASRHLDDSQCLVQLLAKLRVSNLPSLPHTVVAMNHTASKAASAGKAGQSHISAPASNPSLLLDKLSVRRSTPDSEALASSDDELELHRQDSQQSTVMLQKPTRRASWLNDTSQAVPPRKNSFASSSMSPTASHPSTPAAEAGTWSSALPAASAGGLTRPHPAPPSLTWGTGIWNNDSRKDPPSRLTEVLPSPTSLYPPGSNGSFFGSDGGSQPSLLSRDHQQNPTLPFAIPLHPTLKTYRSQSYSVGQLDPDTPTVGAGPPGSSAFSGRARPSQHSGLQHRPSRPSMLSEMTNDSGQLEKLKEIDDDDDSAHESPTAPAQQQSAEAKTIEMLARENAMLRQQQYNNSRLRTRNASVSSSLYPTGNGYGIPGLLPEESDYAIDELDEIAELHDNANKGMLGRRLSEWGPGQGAKLAAYMSVQDRKLESVRKPYWQSSLGFGGLADIPQSRRHSFADIPTRQGSVSSIGEPVAAPSGIQESVAGKENNTRYQDGAAYPMNDHGKEILVLSADPA